MARNKKGVANNIPDAQTMASAFLVNLPSCLESSEPATVPDIPATTVIPPKRRLALGGRERERERKRGGGRGVVGKERERVTVCVYQLAAYCNTSALN